MEWSLRSGIVLTPDRRSPAVIGRIEPISRSTRSAPVDPARGGDLREQTKIQPEAWRIPAADVLLFQQLVSAGEGGTPSQMPTVPPASVTPGLGHASLSESSPADRISATLAHLRHLRGL